MKEEKKVLAARGCGSLVLAFLIVAVGEAGQRGLPGEEIAVDGHSGSAMMQIYFAGL